MDPLPVNGNSIISYGHVDQDDEENSNSSVESASMLADLSAEAIRELVGNVQSNVSIYLSESSGTVMENNANSATENANENFDHGQGRELRMLLNGRQTMTDSQSSGGSTYVVSESSDISALVDEMFDCEDHNCEE